MSSATAVQDGDGIDDIGPFSDHIESCLFRLFSRSYKIGDVVYRISAQRITEYWRIVAHHKGADVYRIERLVTKEIVKMHSYIMYDWDRSRRTGIFKNIPSYVLDVETYSLKDGREPVFVMSA